jgi:hypothetical protein
MYAFSFLSESVGVLVVDIEHHNMGVAVLRDHLVQD